MIVKIKKSESSIQEDGMNLCQVPVSLVVSEVNFLSPFMRAWPGLVPLLLPLDVVRDQDRFKSVTDHNKQTAKDLSQQLKHYNTINFPLCCHSE